MNEMIPIIKKNIQTLGFKFPYTAEEYAAYLYFENYHCHKDFSNVLVADSGEPIENYAKRCLELGAKCLFSGEHGSQGNQFHVYNVAQSSSLKYRHSTEAYWVKDRLADVVLKYDENGNPVYGKDKTNSHMVLVAKNQEGRKDINYILSMANIDGYYYRPRIDLPLLFDIPKDNVIVTSACIQGWAYPDADDIWLRIHEHFGDNFYFEVQANNTDEQKALNEKILRLSETHGIEIIAGLDSHYIGRDGEIKREQILKYKDISYPEETGWYMDYPDGRTLYERFIEQGVLSPEQTLRAIMNTNVFVDECEEITFDRSFKIPSIYPGLSYEEKCKIFKKELNEAYKKEKIKSKEKLDGIRFEAEQIIDSGVVDYFLTNKAIIRDAVDNEGGVLTTTARGSASSFIINKLLGFTTVDRTTSEVPIYPERFLTKERVMAGSVPDIDLNISSPEPFIRAAKKIVGEEGCYPLMAVEKLKVKAAWQLYASVNDISPSDANNISRFIEEYETKLKHTDEDEKQNVKIDDFIPPEYVELFEESKDYQGIIINIKQHACGVLIFDGDVRREIGLISAKSESSGKKILCACIEGRMLDDFGLVKEDFLTVDAVSLTYEWFQSIGRPIPTFDELREMVDGDEATWDIYAKGYTCCVNQCEKESTTQKVMRYKPRNIAELSSFIAAIRPGFATLVDKFLNREIYTTGEEEIDKLLQDTASFCLFQESIMKVLNYLGLEMGETYKVIKNISKKKYIAHPEQLKALKDRLIISWKQKGLNEKNFDNVWDVIEKSAFYSFSGPHAYCMAGDSLYAAWFKAHHTSKFYEVTLTHYQQKGDKNKVAELQKEATKCFGYKIAPYAYGQDNSHFTVDDEKKVIYSSLDSIKGIGANAVKDLYAIYQNGNDNFVDVYLATFGTKINGTVIRNLIKIGYFEKFGTVNKLLTIVDIIDNWRSSAGIKKTFSKSKIAELIINENEFRKYATDISEKTGKVSDKQYRITDWVGLMKAFFAALPEEEISLTCYIKYQLDILGYISYNNCNLNSRYIAVTKLDTKYSPKFEAYCLNNGSTCVMKVHSRTYPKDRDKLTGFKEHPFQNGDVLYIESWSKKNKKRKTPDGKWEEVVDGSPDIWLDKYKIVSNI